MESSLARQPVKLSQKQAIELMGKVAEEITDGVLRQRAIDYLVNKEHCDV